MKTILALALVCAFASTPLSAAETAADFHKAVQQVMALAKEGKVEQASSQVDGIKVPDGMAAREKAGAYRSLAGLYSQLGRDDEFLRNLRAAVVADPGDLESVRVLAASLFYKGRTAEALIYANHLCLEQSPDSAKDDRARNYSERARVELALDLDDRAEDDLKTALKLSPDNALALRTMGAYWLKRGRPAKGMASAGRLIDLTRSATPPERVAAYLSRSSLRMASKEYAQAESDIKEALRVDAQDVGARRAMAQCLVAQGREAEAAAYLSGTDLAQLQFKLGDAAKAEGVLGEVLKSDPGNLSALDAMTQGLSAQSRFKDALPFADRAVAAAQPLSAESRAQRYLDRAGLKIAIEDFPGAQEDLQKAVGDNPGLVEARVLLAVSYKRQAKFKEALATLQNAIAFSTESTREAAGLLTARYAIALESGDKTSADSDLKRALKSDPKQTCLATPSFVKRSDMDLEFFDACLRELPRESSLWADRGVARYLKGQRDAAIEDLTAALKLQPDYLEAAMSLSSVLQEALQKEKARDVITKALSAASKRKSEPIYVAAVAVQAALSSR